MLPKDPAMLLSFINMKLRDQYPNLEECIRDLDVSEEEILETLAGIGYRYDEEKNRFV